MLRQECITILQECSWQHFVYTVYEFHKVLVLLLKKHYNLQKLCYISNELDWKCYWNHTLNVTDPYTNMSWDGLDLLWEFGLPLKRKPIIKLKIYLKGKNACWNTYYIAWSLFVLLQRTLTRHFWQNGKN